MKVRFKSLVTAAALYAAAGTAGAQVFISEVYVNPPASGDDTREYIEITGTPFRKLDGYAIAGVDGLMEKHYRYGTLAGGPPALPPEIDEFFSLDGLSLGANGILVIGVGTPSNYSTLLTDTNFQRWNTIWNGGSDTPGKLQNDGSHSYMLVRRRPGATQADPGNALGVLWGKDSIVDTEYSTDVVTDVCVGGSSPDNPCGDDTDCAGGSCLPGLADAYGDGQLDRGNPDGYGGFTADLIGKATPNDISDDLEVVDEVSWEQTRGHEYDTDDRKVDIGGTTGNLKERKVHTLGDTQGFNPDLITRVDYRTKGAGWNPVLGATGEAAGGKNWQDTATEQWIRGETVTGATGAGSSPFYYFSNAANANPDSVQPYMTNVPLWLADGVGTDFDFTTLSYQAMAGRVNPLAVPFIPGDANRDGVCNQQDIDKIASVFGDADWIFSNAWGSSPQTNDADPATQTRPWDVDGTGNHGIDPADLQWALNFQGNTSGKIVGVRYDSTTPSATGVVLNANTGVNVRITSALDPSCSGTSDYYLGELLTLVVSGEVVGGANTTAGQQNGITQFSHNLNLGGGGVVRVESVEPISSFVKTRASIETLIGSTGDQGVINITGYTTSFGEGLGSAAPLYAVKIRCFGYGTRAVQVGPATQAQLAGGAPQGVLVGHTLGNGDPASVQYVNATTLNVTLECPADFDRTGFVDLDDFDSFVGAFEEGNQCSDFDQSGFVDLDDFDAFVHAFEAGC